MIKTIKEGKVYKSGINKNISITERPKSPPKDQSPINKYGYIRFDDDGNNYIVPEGIVHEFDKDQNEIDCTKPNGFEKLKEFEVKYAKYKVDEDIYKVKVLME